MDEELRELLEKNIALSEEVLTLTKKSHKILFWQRIWGTVKLLLIIIPFILGIIYLPPAIDFIKHNYLNLLHSLEGVDKINTGLLDKLKL